MSSDIEIARKVKMKPIAEIADKLSIGSDDIEFYGKYKAKLPLSLTDKSKIERSKLILVTAISPTPAGEGKTTVSIGLSEGLNRIGAQTTVVLREPSLGPVFGIKGGATGGGWSQVIPMEDINLHFTGDFNAIEKAHNLLSALVDNNLQSKTRSLNIDPRTVEWKRVIDMNDRALRNIVVGLGGVMQGVPREASFDITAASEIMAILCLAEDIFDLKKRLGNIFIGYTFSGEPVYARDLNANGAMTALLKDAIKPNLVQTLEGNPAIIHGGPFANIAQGTNTLIATKMGMSLSDYVVTEGGFGADLGAEKFLDIKCQYGDLHPSAVVIVATVRALKYHGNVDLKELKEENLTGVTAGLANLDKHIENMKKFHDQPVVVINRFLEDTDSELALVKEHCISQGVKCEVANVWGEGGSGSEAAAQMVKDVADGYSKKLESLYEWDWSVEKKIETIAKEIYGASGVQFAAKAKKDLKKIAKLGLEGLPICVAKTQKSLSDNEALRGRPTDFVVTVRNIEIAAGAGFIIPITGNIMRMPGLPATPAAEGIDIDKNGEIIGLF